MARATKFPCPEHCLPIYKALTAVMDHGLRSGEAFDALITRALHAAGVEERTPLDDPQAEAAIEAAFTALRTAVRDGEPFRDYLGVLYMALGSVHQHAWLGQYFTPWPVAVLMAGMQDLDAGFTAKPPTELVRIHDPACGAGVMLLAAAGEIYRVRGRAGLARTSISAVDIDRLCARMTAAQFFLHIDALHAPFGELLVVQANSLTLEEKGTVCHLRLRPEMVAFLQTPAAEGLTLPELDALTHDPATLAHLLPRERVVGATVNQSSDPRTAQDAAD